MKKLAILVVLTAISLTATAATQAPQPSAIVDEVQGAVILQLPDWYQQYLTFNHFRSSWTIVARKYSMEYSDEHYNTTEFGITTMAGKAVQLTPAQQAQLPAIVGAIRDFKYLALHNEACGYACMDKVNYYHDQTLDSNPNQDNAATAQNTKAKATVTPPPQTRAAMPPANAIDAENQWG